MSTARTQFLDDIRIILGTAHGYGAATLSVARMALADDDANALIGGLPATAEGWLCTGSAIHVRRGDAWTHVSGTPSQVPDLTQVLSGEFTLDGVTSLHLRRVAGTLVTFRYIEGEVAAADATTPPTAVVTEDTELVSTESGLRLAYRTYRKAEDHADGGVAVTTWEPWLSRFTGFSSRNEVSA